MLWATFLSQKVRYIHCILNHFYAVRPEGDDFGEITQNKGHGAGQGHSRSPISVPIESSCRIPLSDYYELTSYCAPFPIAYDRSKIALSTPLAFNGPPPPTEGFPWDDLRKMFRGRQRMAEIPNGVETLPKSSTG